MSQKFKGNATLLLTAIVWGTGFIAQKLGNEVLPPMTFNAVRQLMAALVLCPVLAINLKRTGYLSKAKNTVSQLEFKRNKLIKGGLACGVFMMIGTMCQQIGLVTVSAGKSGFISAIYIVFVPLFSVVLGNKVKTKTFACIALAMAGFALLSLKGGLGGATAGDWLTLLSAAAFAAQIVTVNMFVDSHNDILLSVIQMGVSGIIGLPISLIVQMPAISAIIEAMPVLLYSAVVSTAIGYTLQIVGQKYTDSTTAALIMSLEAVFAAIFGAIFLAERMAGRELLGCVVIFVAVILDQIDLRTIIRKK